METTAGTNDSVFDKFLPSVDTELPAAAAPSTPPSTPPSTRARQSRHPTASPGNRAKRDVSPQRDYQKVANSITREALPAGLFNGKAKQLYDCLYSLTRGAIVPSLSVRISRAELMRKSDIGAKVTLEQNLRRLIAAGLVTMRTIGGIQGGNEYTVYLPEEVTAPSTPPSTGASHPSRGQILGTLAPLESSPPRVGVIADSTTTSDEPKTSFKTSTEKLDDEAFATLITRLREATKDITGKAPSAAEAERWGELAGVLVAELEIAAARTTVSSVPSFLTEHLRRRLWKIDKKQAKAEGRELPDEKTLTAQSKGTRACPDCGGSGFWYPEGYEKGVSKCKHERLSAEG